MMGRASGPALDLGSFAGIPLFSPHLVLNAAQLASHKWVMGLTGRGKSKHLASHFLQLFRQGIGVAVIDPHADLTADILATLIDEGYFTRPDAYDKLWYVDFSRRDRFVPFNVLNKPGVYPDAVAQQFVEACTRAWPQLADGAAPRFENIMLATALTLCQNGLPLPAAHRLLTNKSYRDGLLERVTDSLVVSFFHERFDKWGKETPLMIESTLNKLFALLFSHTIRYSVGQHENILDFRRIMDEGIGVIFNLGGLESDTQKFLGCLLTIGFEAAALSRYILEQEQRRQYHLILDEFPMFSAKTGDGLNRVLSLCRKYGLFLTLANQTLHQIREDVLEALQNTLQITFSLGKLDAKRQALFVNRFDPAKVKHVVDDEGAQERTHPVFLSLSEQEAQAAAALADLPARHVLVSVGGKVVKLKTLTFAKPRCTKPALDAVRETYARRLLKPEADVRAALDQLLEETTPRIERVVDEDGA